MKDNQIIVFDEAGEITLEQLNEGLKLIMPKLKHGVIKSGSTKKGKNMFYKLLRREINED